MATTKTPVSQTFLGLSPRRREGDKAPKVEGPATPSRAWEWDDFSALDSGRSTPAKPAPQRDYPRLAEDAYAAYRRTPAAPDSVWDLPKRSVLTSDNDPLRIDWISRDLLRGLGVTGRLGMTLSPGKKLDGITGHYDRSLEKDMAVLKRENVQVVVPLMEGFEFKKVGTPDLLATYATAGMTSIWHPIVDMSTPTDDASFAVLVQTIVQYLAAGKNVLVHCRGGFGRTGIVVASVLVLLGLRTSVAIAKTRQARRGTLQTSTQEHYVAKYEKSLGESYNPRYVAGEPPKAPTPQPPKQPAGK